MAKHTLQQCTIFNPILSLLLLLSLHKLKAEDITPATFTSQQHSVVDEGNRTLTVHTQDGGISCDVVIPHSFSE
ncbi:hypothetical protein [Gimesia chilikensis]|uniref:Uncharacterized protein n=1 Tax=Gimesia chilikensis TaxID=2605989 RepID=A0A517PYD8_9PLAN|nr:hypothetical protein [Gimesia chilikensis]QDT24397.1 hypothetical protein HG66A1_62290 [Gimesia chilikensis]